MMMQSEYAPCEQAITGALDASFGPHGDHAETGRYLAPLLYGKTAAGAERTLRHLLAALPLSAQVPRAARRQFSKAVNRGLRAGRCLNHQQGQFPAAGAYGSMWDSWSTSFTELDASSSNTSNTSSAGMDFDPALAMSAIGMGLSFASSLAGSAMELEGRKTMTAALSSGGASEATLAAMQGQINDFGAFLGQLGQQQQTGQITQAQFDAAVQQKADAIIAETQKEQEKSNSGTVALAVVGGLVAVVVTVLAVRSFGNRNDYTWGRPLGLTAHGGDDGWGEYESWDIEEVSGSRASAGCGCGA